jgi:hypothetical protein
LSFLLKVMLDVGARLNVRWCCPTEYVSRWVGCGSSWWTVRCWSVVGGGHLTKDVEAAAALHGAFRTLVVDTRNWTAPR